MENNKRNLQAFLYTAIGKTILSSECRKAIAHLFQYKSLYQPENGDTNWQIFYRHFQANYIRRHNIDTQLYNLPDGITRSDNNSIIIKGRELFPDLPIFYWHFSAYGRGFKIPTERV